MDLRGSTLGEIPGIVSLDQWRGQSMRKRIFSFLALAARPFSLSIISLMFLRLIDVFINIGTLGDIVAALVPTILKFLAGILIGFGFDVPLPLLYAAILLFVVFSVGFSNLVKGAEVGAIIATAVCLVICLSIFNPETENKLPSIFAAIFLLFWLLGQHFEGDGFDSSVGKKALYSVLGTAVMAALVSLHIYSWWLDVITNFPEENFGILAFLQPEATQQELGDGMLIIFPAGLTALGAVAAGATRLVRLDAALREYFISLLVTAGLIVVSRALDAGI